MILGAAIRLQDQFSGTLTNMDTGITKATGKIKTLNNTKAKPKIQADDKASGEITKAMAKLKILGNMSVRPIVGIRDNITSSIGRIKGALTGLAVLAAGGFGLFALTEKAVEAGDNLYVLSTKLNISAEEASLLGRVLKLTNIEAKPLISTIVRLDKSLETAGKNGNAATDAMSEFGLSLTDAEGNLLSIPKQLEKMAAAYQKAVDVGKEEDFVATVLGPRGMELVPLLQDYTMAMEAASQVKGIGIDPKKAHEQAVAMRVLKLQVGQVGLSLADAFLPFAKHITPLAMTAFSKLAETIKSHSGEIKKFTDDMGVWVTKTVDRITAKFNDPGFQSLDWDGKLMAILDEVAGAVVPKAAEVGLKIGAAFGTAFASGLLDAITTDFRVSFLVGMMVGSKAPGGIWGKLAVGGAIAAFPAIRASGEVDAKNQYDDLQESWRKQEEAAKPKASGLSYVPYDKYPALLHRGERVLTASENRQFDGGGTSGNNPTVNITINAANMNEDQIVSMVENRLLQIAMNMGAA